MGKAFRSHEDQNEREKSLDSKCLPKLLEVKVASTRTHIPYSMVSDISCKEEKGLKDSGADPCPVPTSTGKIVGDVKTSEMCLEPRLLPKEISVWPSSTAQITPGWIQENPIQISLRLSGEPTTATSVTNSESQAKKRKQALQIQECKQMKNSEDSGAGPYPFPTSMGNVTSTSCPTATELSPVVVSTSNTPLVPSSSTSPASSSLGLLIPFSSVRAGLRAKRLNRKRRARKLKWLLKQEEMVAAMDPPQSASQTTVQQS